MQTPHNSVDILIVGADIAGLTAASDLREAGRNVLVIDKGRGVGGRLATRRIGPATFDHGAQFMTARDPRFSAAIEAWRDQGGRNSSAYLPTAPKGIPAGGAHRR